MQNTQNTAAATAADIRSSRPGITRWRVVDIVTASVLGVASGVIFTLWNLAWTPMAAALAFLPGLSGLTAGGWLFAGVLGGIVIRKPGAALYTEILAAVVSMLVGNQWGFSTLIWGILEGAGAELVFALLVYRVWRVWAVVLAGAAAGTVTGLLDTNFSDLAALAPGAKAVYIVSAILSGAVLAGLFSWLVLRGLARTGALSRFASGRSARFDDEPDEDAAVTP